MNSTDKVELQVSESSDGSATVVLPQSEMPPNSGGDQNDISDTPPKGQARDEDADDGDDGHDDNTPDSDPDREAIRQARREERNLKKKLTKARISESNQLINTLKRQNDQMAERLAILEKRTAGADQARLDKAIEDANVRLHYAKMKIKESTEMADGAGLAEAQEAWYDARRQVESLEALKKKAIATPATPAVPKAADPRLKRLAGDWMSRNDWYDPNGRDTDSRVATKIDESLVEEGWDPTTEDYWEELDNRLTKYLPHRYNTSSDGRSSDTPRRPRTVVTGSGRESQSSARGSEFRLSPERVRAIKEAGRWDNIAERNKMIRKYAEYDRTKTDRG
jgi:hypothetical protein